MPCWPRRSPPAPIAPSTASVWARPAACASRAGDAGSPASRTSATIRDCALCCRSQRKGNQGFLLWKDDRLARPHRLERPGGHARLSSPHQVCPADQPRVPPAHGRREPIAREIATSCNWRWKGVPYHKPKHLVGTDTIGLDLGPSSIAIVPREGEASSRVFCEELRPDAQGHPPPAAQDGSAAACRQSGALRRARSHQEARQAEAGLEKQPGATRKPGGAKRPENASWRPIARACMGAWSMRSWRWATPSSLEKISYKAGRNAMGKSVGLRAPGMFDRHTSDAPLQARAAPCTEVPTRTTKLSQWCHGCGKAREKAALAALAHVPLWNRAGAARPVLCVSGRLSRSSRSHPLVCPVCRSLGRCGGAPAGSTRASPPTRE